MADPVVILVGHCGPDAFSLKNVVGRAAPGAEVVLAMDSQTLAEHLPRADLLMINRALEGGFSTSSGVELIRVLKDQAGSERQRYMLISNFSEAQAEAVAAGAAPGFGKSDMYKEEAGLKVRAALGLAEAT